MLPPRPVTNQDGDQLAQLIATVFAEYRGCVFDRAAEFPELSAIADDFAPHGAIWVVEKEAGVIAGCLGIKVSPDLAEAELHKVYLDKTCRGQGTAQVMLQTARDWLMQNYPACQRLLLWTDSRFDAGHRFYQKCGFVQTGETRELADLSQSRELAFAAAPSRLLVAR